jgi:hypothetical protein
VYGQERGIRNQGPSGVFKGVRWVYLHKVPSSLHQQLLGLDASQERRLRAGAIKGVGLAWHRALSYK